MHIGEAIWLYTYSLSIMGSLWTRDDCGARVEGGRVSGMAVEGTPFGYGLGE